MLLEPEQTYFDRVGISRLVGSSLVECFDMITGKLFNFQ